MDFELLDLHHLCSCLQGYNAIIKKKKPKPSCFLNQEAHGSITYVKKEKSLNICKPHFRAHTSKCFFKNTLQPQQANAPCLYFVMHCPSQVWLQEWRKRLQAMLLICPEVRRPQICFLESKEIFRALPIYFLNKSRLHLCALKFPEQ